MAETKTKPTLASLAASLTACQTVTDLFKLAASDAFKADAHTLADDDLKALREAYRAAQASLDGRVRLDAFDGQVISVVDVDYWHSDRFTDASRGQTGDGVTLTFRPDREPDKKYKAVTSSAPIVRFANKLEPLPSEAKPARILIQLEPVRDAERAAKGQKIWKVKRLPAADVAPSGQPF